MGKINSRNLLRLFLLGNVLLFASSFKPDKPQDAKFDYFTYKGEDDFYAQNPLPGNDYFYNPILPGWNSDPSICTNGEDYFMVTSTFSYFPGVPLFHSKDLVNWKQVSYVLDRESQLPLKGQKTSAGIFAPAISYNPANQTYYMITTNVGAGNFFVKTKDPFGKWSEPIWLKDVRGIDPSFFFDDNGHAYILNNDEPEGKAMYDGHRAIWIQEFDVNTDKAFGPRKVLINGGIHFEEKPIWIEGPHMYKIKGKYFLMDAEGGTSVNHSEVILTGTDPMGEFKPCEKNPILTQRHLNPNRKEPITCAGHADLVQTKAGDWWAVFLACRPIDGKFENLGRETFLLPVRWTEDGYPFMTEGDETIPMIVQKKDAVRQADAKMGNFESNESFDGSTLGLDWLTLRTPAKELYSLTETPGFLTLKSADTNASETNTPAFVGRRMQHHKFESTTSLDFNPVDEKEAAGMLLYKDELHQYFLSVSKSGKGRKVSVVKISKEGSQVVGSQDIKKGKPVQLKVVSKGTTYDFYYSLGNNKWVAVATDVDARYLSTANSWGFTGTTIGLYATKKPF
jgi:alpha-N-arabinofuranosidase